MPRIFAAAALALITCALAGGCGDSAQTRSQGVIAYSDGLNIVVLDLETRARTTVVAGRVGGSFDDSGDWAIDPVWSPDGTRIAYIRDAVKVSVWVVDVATKHRRRISGNLGSDSGLGLRWSPDGRWLAFRDSDAGILWVARSDGGGGRRLFARAHTESDRGLGTLGWTRDGRIVFHVGPTRLAARPEGGRARPYGAGFQTRNLGPDGVSRLVVKRDAHGNDQVVVQRPPGTTLGALTADRRLPGRLPIRSSGPSWSADGRWVAFNRNGSVVVVDAHGRFERTLLSSAAVGPWSPDGHSLLVRSLLGYKPLWVFDPASGRHRLVASSVLRRDGLYVHQGTSWRPQRPTRFTTTLPERPVPHVVETDFPERQFALGHVHIEDGRHLPFPKDVEVVDVSSNGRLVGLWIPTGRNNARIAVFDLATGSLRDVGLGAAPGGWPDGPYFDPRGRRVLYRHWNQLRIVSLATGRTSVVTTAARLGTARWLDDGGLAYVDRANALVVRRRDGTVRRRTQFSPGAAGSLAVAPDGDRVLYGSGCDVWLADLATGVKRRFARARYMPTPDSWSPDGRHIVLADGAWIRCNGDRAPSFDWYPDITLMDLRGRVIDSLTGGLSDWSADGHFLLTSGGVTGTEVAGSQPLVLTDVRTRRNSVLLPGASTGLGLVLPGRRLIFGGFDNAGGVHTGGDMEPRVYIGRFTG